MPAQNPKPRMPAQSPKTQTAHPAPSRSRSKNPKNQTPQTKPKKPGPQGPQLHVSGIAAIVSGMALPKFPFLSLQAGKLLRSLALARLPR